MRLVIERTRDQNIEAGIARLARRLDEIGVLGGAELRPDENGSALLGLALQVVALGADEVARPRYRRHEICSTPFVRLPHGQGRNQRGILNANAMAEQSLTGLVRRAKNRYRRTDVRSGHFPLW
jgi:hypothetical protein